VSASSILEGFAQYSWKQKPLFTDIDHKLGVRQICINFTRLHAGRKAIHPILIAP
jgi:hypothetical protein